VSRQLVTSHMITPASLSV